MNFLAKCRETALSVLPVMGIVLVLGLFVVPAGSAPAGWLPRFLVGGALLIVGLTIFLLGVDLGIQPMGERCGAALTKRRSLGLLLGSAFCIGLIVTAAEPDIQVFGDQVHTLFPDIRKSILTFAIAAGVGLFMVLGLLRTMMGWSIKAVFAVSHTILFAVALLAPTPFIGIAFDSGGATTGPMTVPFIMALGLGVAAVRADENGSFGLTGTASVGPILAVLLYAAIARPGEGVDDPSALAATAAAADGSVSFARLFTAAARDALHESLTSIGPLFILFLLFQFLLLRMTARQTIRLAIGFVYAFIGLTVFLLGVGTGFMQAGTILGQALGSFAAQGPLGFAALLGVGLLLGAIIVCAEPAVWVLSEQVEQVSGGTIPRRMLLFFLSAATAVAIALAMWRAVSGFSLAWLLIPGYALALLLLAKAPPLFVGIAFDSGGVASGPLTSTFILSFTLGAASAGARYDDSFGVIALVAMMPLVTLQIMGILYERKRRKPAA